MTLPRTRGLDLPGPAWTALLAAPTDSPLPGLLDGSGAAYVLVGSDRAADAPGPSPTVVGTLLARRTRRVGVVVAASPQRDHPYNVARRVASLDHVSGGRAGWLALRRDRALALGVADGSTWAAGDLGPDALADGVGSARALWRSWPIESLDPDPEVALATRLPYAEVGGTFPTRGPLNVPTTPQGEPVVLWDLREAGEVDAAVAAADVVLVDQAQLDAGTPAVVAALAAPDDVVRMHVRVQLARADTAGLRAALERHAADPHVSGVVLTIDAADDAADLLGALAADALPTLRADGLLAPVPTGAGVPTLRASLDVPRRSTPDLSGNATAYPESESA